MALLEKLLSRETPNTVKTETFFARDLAAGNRRAVFAEV
jgi:hypothetical protein